LEPGIKKIHLIIILLTSLCGCAVSGKQAEKIVGIDINGETWMSVPDFSQSSPNDHHYVLKLEDDAVQITFGDGVNGKRLPEGQNQIRVRYQRGGGNRYTSVHGQQGGVNIDNCR